MKDATASEGRTESAIAFLRELIAAQVAGEPAVQAAIAARLARAGCDVRQHEYDPAKVPVKGEIDAAHGATGLRSAVVGTLGGQADLPSLLIFAHPDGEPVTDADQWAP